MRPNHSLLVLAVAILLLVAGLVAASTATTAGKESKKRRGGPFQRLQQSEGAHGLDGEAEAGRPKARHAHDHHPAARSEYKSCGTVVKCPHRVWPAGYLVPPRIETMPNACTHTHTLTLDTVLAPVGTPEKVAFLQGIQKNGIDPIDVLTTALASSAFMVSVGVWPAYFEGKAGCRAKGAKRAWRSRSIDIKNNFDLFIPQEKILGNAEIQHRMLESLPMLHAIPGFAEVKGRRLSDEEVGEWVAALLLTARWMCL